MPVPLDPFEHLLSSLSWRDQLVHLERLEARPPVHAEPELPLHPLLAERLPPLYTHQARAIDAARRGRSVAVATGTGSGKSLCFQVPIAHDLLNGPDDASALLVYPTKALAQDQLRSIAALEIPGLVP